MAWLQFTLPATAETVETWSEALLDAGAVSVSIENIHDEAIFELEPTHQPMWQKPNLLALFSADLDPLEIQHELLIQIPAEIIQQGSWSALEDQDWVRKSQEHMQPMCFANHLWVCPSWSAIPDPTAVNIILDPEIAFGTGAHATTALCLEWLVHNIKPGQSMLDYGCGSGILAIAAAKLGAATVYAVDIDPVALEITTSNALKNNINSAEQSTLTTYLPEQMPAVCVDVVVANILAQTLRPLGPQLAAYLQSGGSIVLSGIMEDQADDLIQLYSQWFIDFHVQNYDAWARITAIRV